MHTHGHTRTRSRALAAARLALAASVLTLLASLAFAVAQHSQAEAGQAEAARATASAEEGRPNFVVVQTDDETLDQLYAAINVGGLEVQAMPYTLSLIANRGITFNRYYVSYPLCCPSRVSLLTGRYAHSHNVRGNVPPNAGYTGFKFRQAYSHNLATWLQGGGYRTIHVGKFLNGYGDEPFDNGADVPPGWSAWHSVLRADTHHYFYGYTLNEGGALNGPIGDSGSWETREYGERDYFGCPATTIEEKPCLYQTDSLTRIAVEELWTTPAEQPFYLQLDYTAPHGDFRRPAGPEPAMRHYNTFAGAPYPHSREEGFNEGNVRDKPSFIRDAPYLTFNEIHTYRVYYQKGLESLRSIDEGVKQVVDILGAMQRLRNTYIIFTSDNGFFYGEHRLTGGKLIRGPGIKPGTATGELASNIDIAPTILELAGVEPDKSIDGRSLVPYMRDPALRTRRPILFESFVQTNDVEASGQEPAARASTAPSARRARRSGATASIVAPPKDYLGIRLGPYKYIEWPNGEKELYDITKDPNELNNMIKVPNLFPIRAFLHAQLVRLESCTGRACQEPAPPFPLTRKQQQQVDKQRREEERRKQKEQEQKKFDKRRR
jgi:N-acetylglucosamine-6-sulfatase